MAARGPQNGRRGLERGLPLGFGALPSTFTKKGGKEKKRIVKIVVHYHYASEPPEWRLTGMPTARANC